ncbi:MAG: carbohydrate ABC transporter permease [Anaerocolumna sp.]
MGRQKKKTKIIINSILSVLAVIWIFPVLFTILGALKGKQEYNLGNIWDLPKSFLLFDNLGYLSKGADIFRGMLSSLFYAASGALFSVIIATLAAYAIAKLEIKFRMFWFLFIYCGTIFPFQIYLIPVYRGFSKLHLYDTRAGMILFYTAICIPFSMFVLRNFFIGISNEISESAQIDGCSNMQILIKIFVPMAKAPLSIVLLSQFTWVWNDLMFGITFTKSSKIRPVMAAISLMGKAHIPALLVGCIIASVPTILLFIFLQKNFEAGFAYQSK